MIDKTPTDYAALLKRSLVAIDELEERLATLQRSKNEPVAIIGLACRFPGGADSPEAFWDMLLRGVDAVSEVPRDRWDVEQYYDPDPDAFGKSYTRWGSFINGVGLFDADLFGVTPREAVSLDPQQRMLLEVVWEALERAGIAPHSLTGTPTAAFVGITTFDYVYCAAETTGLDGGNAYSASGTAHSMASGRLAYAFGLTGPNAAVDTACSSSHAAIHLAVQSLRNREASLALAGGVNLTLHPSGSILTSRARMMSPTGRCNTFDSSADGYVRGEGCGMLVLKRLSDAQRDGDQVLAVIRGTALNQDGRSSGLTAPNGRAQEAVIRAALDNAGLKPEDIDYVEAHGTGTSLGDPIEMKALGEVFASKHSGRPLHVASVKTNIGHGEAAAGIAGIIKTVMALRHGMIPPHLHLKNPNPLIPWDRLPVRIPDRLISWEAASGQPRRAGVNSFGFSGTNGHVVLEQAPVTPAATHAASSLAQPVVLSAQTPQALAELAGRFSLYLTRGDAEPLAHVAHALARSRSQLAERLAIVATDSDDASSKLAAFASGNVGAATTGRAASGTAPELVFLFTGQGAQYAGMGRTLYETEAVFRSTLDRCAAIVDAYLPVPLLEVIAGQGSAAGLVDDTAYTQPALFAIEYSLAELWRSWGVEPTAVMGHSVGEYVAAVLAGVFSLEDGLKLIAARGRLMSALPRDGAMVAVFANEAIVRPALDGVLATVSIAAVNGPANTVISGASADVDTVVARLTQQAIEVQRLTVSHAFHSPLMEPMLDDFEKVAATVSFRAPRIGLMSNVTGAYAGADVTTPSYWRQHVRDAVRFGDSVTALLQDGYRSFLEIGPAATLAGMGRRCPGADAATFVSSLRKGVDDRVSMLESLGHLYVKGQSLDWSAVFAKTPTAAAFDLPTYAFQRRHFWHETTGGGIERARLLPLRFPHSLLGGAIDGPLRTFQTEIGLGTHPWLADHQLLDLTPFPATGFIELVVAAVREATGAETIELRDVTIREGLMLPAVGTVAVQVVVTGNDITDRQIQVFSRADAPAEGGAPTWRLHMSARQAPVGEHHHRHVPVLDGAQAIDAAGYYARLVTHGVDYGPAFRGIRSIAVSDREVLADLELPVDPNDAASRALIVHPALLDAAVQLVGLPVAIDPDHEVTGQAYLPVGIERYAVYIHGARAARCYTRLDPSEKRPEILRGDLAIFDEHGTLIAEMVGLAFRQVTRAVLMRAINASSLGRDEWEFEVAWRASAPPAESPHVAEGSWILLADHSGVAVELARRLSANGATVTLIRQQGDPTADAEALIVDSTDSTAVGRAFMEATQRGKGPLSGVVSLWALDAPTPPLIRTHGLDVIEFGVQRLIQSTLNTVQALSTSPAPFWLVTRGAQPASGSVPDLIQAPLVGLGNVIAAEAPDLRCIRIDMDSIRRPAEPDLLFDTIWHADVEDRIALRDGSRLVGRMVAGTLSEPSEEARILEITERGQLDNLQYRPVARRPPGKGEVEIRVHATGLNFRDVLNALGMYPGDPGPLGNECSGIVSAVGEGVTSLAVGDAVVSMINRSFATHVIAPEDLTVIKPPQVSFIEAATIPLTFLTGAYALRNLGRIRKGDRVLIHAVTGGVGMAAVQLARQAGAEIIGTAGSPAKRALAKALGVHHVADSRSLSFEADVREATGGEGVDIVLNSLAGDFIPASLRLLRPGGRFIEIGKTGIWDTEQVAAQFPHVEYYALYLGEVAVADPLLIKGMLQELMEQLVSKELDALPRRVFPIERAQDAFRYMAQGHHVGKIVLAQRLPIRVLPEASYLITGGTGGLGLTCARWLGDLGAKHLVLLARREPTPEAQEAISALQTRGIEVRVARLDVADTRQVDALLLDMRESMPPLRGVLHTAGSLDDGMLSEQTWTRFERVMSPKVRGTWNLHTATQSSPLDFFVMFSSGAALLGSPGQANYAAANSFMDSLAYVRQGLGLPALSINWGTWADVGMAAQISEQHQRRWASLGLKMIEPTAGVQMLQRAIEASSNPQIAALPIVRSRFSTAGPFFSEVVSSGKNSGQDTSGSAADILARLKVLQGDDRMTALVGFLAEQVTRVFALSASHKIDPRRSLMQMGMDSLMAMELRNRLQSALKVPVQVADLLTGPTLEELATSLSSELPFAHATATVATAGETVEAWEQGSL